MTARREAVLGEDLVVETHRDRPVVSEQRFHMLHGPVEARDLRFESCEFDNCRATNGMVQRIEAVSSRVWSSSLRNVIIEDCTIDGMRKLTGGGGKSMPFFLDGCVMRRVTLRGTLNSTIWNPPSADPRVPEWIDAPTYYEATDWAVDVSEARFRSIPSFRYGPPGHLVRRDPDVQPLITRGQAAKMRERFGSEIGVWNSVLGHFGSLPWLDSMVLIPGVSGPKRKYEEELASLDKMRRAGGFDG